MADTPLFDPFGANARVVPLGTNPSGAYPGPSLYQIALALVFLYLIMAYVPYGLNIGLILLLGALLASKDVVSGFQSFVNFVLTGKG